MGLEDVQVAQAQDEVLGPIMIALQRGEKCHLGCQGVCISPSYKAKSCAVNFKKGHDRQMYTNCHPEEPDTGCPKQLHDQAGHLRILKTTEKVKEHFYWPGYEQDIRTWVQNCVQCQQRNPPIPQAQAPLGTIQASYPFEKMSWERMGPMPVTERH